MTSLKAPHGPGLSTLTPGQLQEQRLPGTADLLYFAYRPRQLRQDQPPLVYVHGYNRRAEAHARALLPLCDALGCPLLAPLFNHDQHPRYQRLGRGNDGLRADRVLNACLEDMFGDRAGPIHLTGFSGGAQFAHRYTMAHPGHVASQVIIAAGWYTLPDETQRYPLGLHTHRALRGLHLNPERFLRVPTTVIVGDQDTGRQNLRSSPELNLQQGATRVERARNWVAHMRLSARSHQLPSRVQYLEIPDIDHDFNTFIERGHLLSLLGHSLGCGTQAGLGRDSVMPLQTASR